jgi:site-specific DNA-methyltransferase (adenine-specific)|tara:strand:+ start:636 stop:1466 length:831 start_codon:yes stop_codon:yes gene_type:complete
MMIRQGNCMELMQDVETGSVDLILCDLPYGTTDRKGKGGSRIFKWDSPLPLDDLWVQYRRILSPSGTVVLFGDQPFTSKLVLSNVEWFKYEWIWKKSRTTGFLLANYRPMKQTEDILVFSQLGAAAASAKTESGNMVYNPQGLIPKVVKKKNNPKRLGKVLGVTEFIGKGNKLLTNSEYEQKFTNYPKEILEFAAEKNTVHPTQKPVSLLEYLIETYSHHDDLVMDNCMGAGSTGVACVNTSRRFVGFEMEEEYFKHAKSRIEEAQTKLAQKAITG